ncbi:MAG: hypothetical protein BMS9Abin05_2378 [Rhodothermia bacterium]|nr:MAG: hypothetical protein BMS9Abin05_2378 [Rhodothermia bacterium]
MLNLLKSRVFLVGQGLLMLVVLVIVLGRIFNWSPAVQLFAIIGILLIGIVMLVIGYVRANKSASAIQKSIHSQAEQQRQSVRPDNQAEIEQLQRDLEDAIERLKHSKLGGGRSGKAALYALPWYMIIGPPAAGKTTAITNSGLNFPIGMEAFRGVGGTRNCDWFFSDSAIFLDTAGRYMTEQDDVEEWNTFLQTLKENRRKQPVNGIMVAISINELADATPDQIEWHASTIRRRIDDLVTRLDVTFPIYLIFTKLDLIRGFTQFFGALSRKEREQILGCTLPQKWEEESNLRELFENEFGQIASALLNWRNEGLGLAMKRAERHLVYVFPLEFASLKEKLTQFVTMLFQPNPYRDTPAFRGFYFSSGTQEGVPIDRVLSAIAGRFGFETATFEESEPVTETKAYFIKDIFEKVIIPDKYLVSQTSRAAVRGRFVKSGIAAATLILLVLFVIGAGQAVVRSSTRLGVVQQAASEVSQLNFADTDLTDEAVDELESLQSLITRLESPPVFGWRLDRGSDVRDPARKVFLEKVRELVNEYVFLPLQDRIDNVNSRPYDDDSEKFRLEQRTMAYLLLTSNTAVLDTVAGVSDFLKLQMKSMASESPSLDNEKVQVLLDAFVDGIRDNIVVSFSEKNGLVSRASNRFNENVSYESLYRELKSANEGRLGITSLSSMLGRNATFFDTDPEISNFFTQGNWESFVADKITEKSTTPGRDDWVPWAKNQLQVDDPDILEKELTRLYLIDYRKAWIEFLRAARIKSFENVNDAAKRLKVLADPEESPILLLLLNVGRETFPSESENPQREPTNYVESTFQSLHELKVRNAPSGGEADALKNVLNVLSTVGQDMELLVGNNSDAAEYAQRVLNERGVLLRTYYGDIQEALRDQSSVISNILIELFQQPVILAWEALLGSVQTHLDNRWRTVVYEDFQTDLKGKYPLGNRGEAIIGDFEVYFRPDRGTFSTFVTAELMPFLDENTLLPRTWVNRGIRLSRATRTALERVRNLQNLLYDGDRLKWTLELAPDQPEQPSALVESYVVNIHGNEHRYDLGPRQRFTIVWPGESDVKLQVFLEDDSRLSQEYQGEWALFKFLAAAGKYPQEGNRTILKWDMSNDIRAVYEAWVERGDNPLSNANFFKINIPEKLGN